MPSTQAIRWMPGYPGIPHMPLSTALLALPHSPWKRNIAFGCIDAAMEKGRQLQKPKKWPKERLINVLDWLQTLPQDERKVGLLDLELKLLRLLCVRKGEAPSGIF